MLVVALLAAMATGIPVALALLAASLAGYLLVGERGVQFLAFVIWAKAANFEFLAAPLFVFMGFLLERAGIVAGIFQVVNAWFGRLPGSAGVVTVISSGVFAALSGSGAAASAALGSTLAPEARNQGFNMTLLAGLLNGGASLAPLIPPSLAMIVYSSLTETPLTRLFAAGLVPGLLMMMIMVLYAVLVATWRPALAPRPAPVPQYERIRSLRHVPITVLVIFVTLGGIFLGWYTPTEAAAIGVVLALILIVLNERFRPKRIAHLAWTGSMEAATVAVFLMFVIVAGSSLSAVLAFIGVPQLLAAAIRALALDTTAFLVVVAVLVILLGMFVDAITLQILVVPFLFPTVIALGVDPLWFGVYLVFLIEVGTFTPPYGLHLFVVQGVLRVPYQSAVKGAVPLIPMWAAAALFLITYPQIATWLPSVLFQ